jgi:hypothetical protein
MQVFLFFDDHIEISNIVVFFPSNFVIRFISACLVVPGICVLLGC